MLKNKVGFLSTFLRKYWIFWWKMMLYGLCMSKNKVGFLSTFLQKYFIFWWKMMLYELCMSKNKVGFLSTFWQKYWIFWWKMMLYGLPYVFWTEISLNSYWILYKNDSIYDHNLWPKRFFYPVEIILWPFWYSEVKMFRKFQLFSLQCIFPMF